jgi:hypothetical protein
MRTALLEDKRLGFGAKAGGYIKCNKRISRLRVKCKMAWVVGDSGFSGRGMIWITERGGKLYWHPRYTLVLLNEYCAAVEHGSHCTRTLTFR